MHRIGVLFVCLGNICRSPSAQAVLEDRLERRRLAARFRVDSCGTAAFNAGKPPDPRAIAAAERRGYRIAHQRARQIDDADFGRFRYIVAMDRSNLHTLQGWATADFGGEIRLLMHFATDGATARSPTPITARRGPSMRRWTRSRMAWRACSTTCARGTAPAWTIGLADAATCDARRVPVRMHHEHCRHGLARENSRQS